VLVGDPGAEIVKIEAHHHFITHAGRKGWCLCRGKRNRQYKSTRMFFGEGSLRGKQIVRCPIGDSEEDNHENSFRMSSDLVFDRVRHMKLLFGSFSRPGHETLESPRD
jgi:hypothetical protein